MPGTWRLSILCTYYIVTHAGSSGSPLIPSLPWEQQPQKPKNSISRYTYVQCNTYSVLDCSSNSTCNLSAPKASSSSAPLDRVSTAISRADDPHQIYQPNLSIYTLMLVYTSRLVSQRLSSKAEATVPSRISYFNASRESNPVHCVILGAVRRGSVPVGRGTEGPLSVPWGITRAGSRHGNAAREGQCVPFRFHELHGSISLLSRGWACLPIPRV